MRTLHVRYLVLAVLALAAMAGCSEKASSPFAGQSVPPPSSRPTSVEPAPNSIDVSPATAIRLRYQDRLDGGTVNTSNVTLTEVATGDPVPSTVVLDPDRMGFSIEPVAPLLASATRFRVTVNGRPGVRFATGRAVDDFTFEFETSPDPAFATGENLPDAVGDSSRGPGTDYSETFDTTGGTAPLTFRVVVGVLPSGLSLDEITGEISGRAVADPDVVVTTLFTVRVEDADGRFADKEFRLRTIPSVPPLGIDFAGTSANFEAAKVVAPFDAEVVIDGGLPPYELVVLSGDLPNGTDFADNPSDQPRIFGTWLAPAAADETAVFTLQVTDAIGTAATSSQFTIQLPPVGAVSVTNADGSSSALRNGFQGQPYSDELALAGALGPFVADATPSSPAYAVSGITYSGNTASAAPFTFSSGGSNLGAAAVGDRSFSFRFRDQAGRLIARTFSQRIFNNIAVALSDSSSAFTAGSIPDVSDPSTVRSLPDAMVDDPSTSLSAVFYSQTITISGGNTPYTITVTNHGIPSGLSLGQTSTTVTVSGNPTTAGQRGEFTVQVVDAASQTASRRYNIRSIPEPPEITSVPSPMSPALCGFTYSGASRTFTATNGTAPLQWDIASGTTPPGLDFTGSGSSFTVTGVPTADAGDDPGLSTSGSYSFTVRVRSSLPDRLSNTGVDPGHPADTQTSSLKVYLSYRSNIYPNRGPAKPSFFLHGCQSCHGSGGVAAPNIDFEGDGNFVDNGITTAADASGLVGVGAVPSCGSGAFVHSGSASQSVVFLKYGNRDSGTNCAGIMPPSASDATWESSLGAGDGTANRIAARAILERWINEHDDSGNPNTSDQ